MNLRIVEDFNSVKEYKCKIAILGESAVGKTCIVVRYTRGTFSNTESTVGAAFAMRNLDVDDGVVKFEIWDTAGEERYHSLAPMYYRKAQAALVVYDITYEESFTRAKTWVRELNQQVDQNTVIALVGNKSDLADKRMIDYNEGEKYAKNNGLLFMETSARTGQNVEQIFREIGKTVSEREPVRSDSETIELKEGPKKFRRKCCKS